VNVEVKILEASSEREIGSEREIESEREVAIDSDKEVTVWPQPRSPDSA
jgi:hypothetical protein